MKIKFSEEASRQLDEIAENIKEFSGTLAARRFNKELKRKLCFAIEHPEMYPATVANEKIRRVILRTRPHVCFYEIMNDEILVLAVVLNLPRAENP